MPNSESVLGVILIKAWYRQWLYRFRLKVMSFIRKPTEPIANTKLSAFITTEEKLAIVAILAKSHLENAVDDVVSQIFKFYIEGAQLAGNEKK